MIVRDVDYGAWLLRVAAWDGLLPACVLLLPTVIEFLVPNNRGAIEVAAVTLPIAAFFLRIRVGKRQIGSNNCGNRVRLSQYIAFCLGILVLTLVDAVLILSHVMPPGAWCVDKNDMVVWAVLALAYLASMGIAMYPGATETAF